MIRQNGKEYQIYTIDDIDYSVFQVKDGDALTAEAILDRFENKLEIKGLSIVRHLSVRRNLEYSPPTGGKG